MDPFSKVPQDAKGLVGGRAWNELMSMLVWWRGAKRDASFVNERLKNSQTRIKVRNDSGSPRQRFDIVRLGHPLFFPEHLDPDDYDDDDNAALAFFHNQLAMSAVSPARGAPFAVLVEPIPQGGVGEAVLVGLTVCKVAVAPGMDTYIGARANNAEYTKLVMDSEASEAFAQVLWIEPHESDDLPADLWAIVLLNGRVDSINDPITISSLTPDGDGLLPGTVQPYFDPSTIAVSGSESILIFDLNG